MSDNIRDDNVNVDPRLDALLSRALGRGSVPRPQRQGHLERLGLAPRLGGSAGTWRAPVVAGRPPSASAPTPESLPARRRRRQWLELGAAVLAVILVGGLLVALFRDWSGGEDDQQLAASPEATSPPATATPRETREQLYVVSHAMRQAQDALITEGRVSAIDPETGEEFWSVEAGPRIDSVLSPDGKRLFVADSKRDGDFVYALDTQTGRELWRQPIEDRLWHKPGAGYSTLTVSADGGTVSVYSCEGCIGEFRFTDGRNWLAQFDAVTGNRQPDIEIPACRGKAFRAPEGPGIRPLYIICDQGRLEMLDPATGDPLELTYDAFVEGGFPESTSAKAGVVSPDGRTLYLASGDRLTVIDMTRQAARRIQLDEDVNVDARLPLLALSADGSRLFIGSLDTGAYDRGRAEANRVDVYDTNTWEPLGQVVMGSPLNGMAFTSAPDGDSVYSTFSFYPMTDDNVTIESTILRLSLDGEPATVATRTNEEVLYLFAGMVEVDPDVAPRPTPTPEPTAYERLFAVAHMLTPTGDAVASGQVTAYDAETGEIAYRIDTGWNPDAILSPDGTRLYIAANSDDGDTLSSYDALSGDRNWSVPIEHRLQTHYGDGPTRLAVSQDGSRLFVYSASAPGDYFIQVFDTADGRLGRVIDGVAGCAAQLFPSADGRSLYVVCLAERFAPQVIDLEAWTSAGVMQGFGGVITGAAASPDGRWLYIPQDIDTEMSLSVIDMNGRVVSDMRSIVHMDRDPLHMLNITAVSPDGSRLFIGLGSQPEGEAGVAERVWVWDTANLHHDPWQMNTPEPINSWSLAPGPDNGSVFAIHNEDGLDAGGQPSREAIVMRLGIEGGSDEFVRQWGGDILRVFSGRVTDTPEPPSTDRPEPAPPTLPDGASICPAMTWSGPEVRDFGGLPDWYWIDGDGLAIGDADGRLVEGQNEIAWIAGPSQQLVDPAVGVSLRGTRLQTGYERSVPLEVRDQEISQVEPMGDAGVRRYLRSTVIFPSPGCWQIEAEMGDKFLMTVVNVEPDSAFRNSDAIWDTLRWRPLHELGIDPTPACLRMPGQQVIDDFGPLVGDMQINGGPVYLNGPGEDGAIQLLGGASDDGGYYTRVMFVTDGSYDGPMLVRAAPGSGPVGFTLAVPDTSPASEWHLDGQGGTSPTAGVRHWIVYLRFSGPGCHALQIDGLDFTSIIVFEVLAEGGS